MAKERLLLVDDEENLRSMLEAALRHLGFEVHPRRQRARGARRGRPTVQPDLIVLDVMLPDLDGFEVCRRLRTEGSRTPVLFLTARDGTEDKVRGPHARRRRLPREAVQPRGARRPHQRGAAPRRARRRPDAVLRCADLEMDDDAHRVLRGGDEVSLSPTEYNLLRYLLVNQGRVLSKAQILDHVWQYDFGGDGGVVETYIGYLRRKVDNVEPRLIHTIRGVGYTLREPQLTCTMSLRAPPARRHGGRRRSCSCVARDRRSRRTTEPYLVDQVDDAARGRGRAAGASARARPGRRPRDARPGQLVLRRAYVDDDGDARHRADQAGVDDGDQLPDFRSTDVARRSQPGERRVRSRSAATVGPRYRVLARRDRRRRRRARRRALPLDDVDDAVAPARARRGRRHRVDRSRCSRSSRSG